MTPPPVASGTTAPEALSTASTRGGSSVDTKRSCPTPAAAAPSALQVGWCPIVTPVGGGAENKYNLWIIGICVQVLEGPSLG